MLYEVITNTYDKLLAHCHRRRYTAKSTIIYAGDRCESLFFISYNFV